jgi:cytochrome c553
VEGARTLPRPQGEGDDAKEIPRISAQHAGYLARQIYDAVDNRRPMLARSHGKRFAPLDFQDVLGLSDYLARIGWQGDESAGRRPCRDAHISVIHSQLEFIQRSP